MNKYKVIDILEQDYGCEELPPDQKVCVDVILENIKTKETLKISTPDDNLYKKNIDINSIVTYDNKELNIA